MTRAVPLSAATLAHHAARVAVPSYDRRALVPSVVHLSVGSFHRSHQAVHFDDLARLGERGWGLVGVGLRRPGMGAALTSQDGLYTVVSRGAEGDHARIVGVIRRYLHAPRQWPGVLAALAHPRTRLVTLTVTGHGYQVRPDDLTDGARPRSAMGFLVEALDQRRRAGLPPFTVLSCDNLPGNGRLARDAVLGLARLRDTGLAAWIGEHGAFPSSMVDRITPQTSPEDRERVARDFGVDDLWPVVTEPWSQWLIEDEFCRGRPPLDRVGVRFVEDVGPYAKIKTRLLNGTHCAVGYLGHVAGVRTMDEAVGDPVLGAYAERLMAGEVAPLLPRLPGMDLETYRTTLLERFANPKIADPLERLCRNGSAKMPVHVLSSIADARAGGRPHPLLTLAVAGWMRHLRGTDEGGRPVAIDDPHAARLCALARAGGSDPRPLLVDSGLFGPLGQDPSFAAELQRALEALDGSGVREAVTAAFVDPGAVAA